MSILLQFVIHCTYHILVRHSVTETAIFMIHWCRWLHQNCTMIDVVWENWNDVTYKNRLMIQPFQCTNRETDGRTDGRTSNNIGLYSEYCHSNSMHTLTVSYLRRSLLAGLRLPFRKKMPNSYLIVTFSGQASATYSSFQLPKLRWPITVKPQIFFHSTCARQPHIRAYVEFDVHTWKLTCARRPRLRAHVEWKKMCGMTVYKRAIAAEYEMSQHRQRNRFTVVWARVYCQPKIYKTYILRGYGSKTVVYGICRPIGC